MFFDDNPSFKESTLLRLLSYLKDTKHIITPDAMDIAKNFIGRY